MDKEKQIDEGRDDEKSGRPVQLDKDKAGQHEGGGQHGGSQQGQQPKEGNPPRPADRPMSEQPVK